MGCCSLFKFIQKCSVEAHICTDFLANLKYVNQLDRRPRFDRSYIYIMDNSCIYKMTA